MLMIMRSVLAALLLIGTLVQPADAPTARITPEIRAATAVQTAAAQLGLPYTWGGDGPTAGDPGFDCSGLTRFAYAASGIKIPRTAFGQYYAGPVVVPGAPLRAGDLVFYGVPSDVYHVGLYVGDGRMINATTFGEPIRVSFARWKGDDYFGATRPTAPRGAQDVVAPPPAPARQSSGSRIFDAPPASPDDIRCSLCDVIVTPYDVAHG